MKLLAAQYWYSEQAFDQGRIEAALAPHFCLEFRHPELARLTLLDTQDWDIWRAGAVLCRFADGSLQYHSAKQTLHCDQTSKMARFWWDLAPGELQDCLKRRCKLRAFLVQAEFQIQCIAFWLCNTDKKIVVKGELSQVTQAGESGLCHGISLYPLRGYEEEFATARRALQNVLAKSGHSKTFNRQQTFLHWGLRPPQTTKSLFDLPPQATIRSALPGMLKQMLHTATDQIPGIVEDIDTEYLHNYRVHLRKAHSLVSLARKALGTRERKALSCGLSQLAKRTNRLRDLDVFLLDRSQYEHMLPAEFTLGIDHLFSTIRQERRREQRAIVRFFNSKKFTDLSVTLNAELKALAERDSPLGNTPVWKFASKNIYKRYQKIVTLGADIKHDTTDDEVHAIRIHCKKLRYLMELFAEVFPTAPHKANVKHLKALQDVLGEFNDCAVQREFLAAYCSSEIKDSAIMAAANGLITLLHQQQQSARARVGEAFAEFSAAQTALAFKELYRTKAPKRK